MALTVTKIDINKLVCMHPIMFPDQVDTNIPLNTVKKQQACVSVVKAFTWGVFVSSSYPVVHATYNFFFNYLVLT